MVTTESRSIISSRSPWQPKIFWIWTNGTTAKGPTHTLYHKLGHRPTGFFFQIQQRLWTWASVHLVNELLNIYMKCEDQHVTLILRQCYLSTCVCLFVSESEFESYAVVLFLCTFNDVRLCIQWFWFGQFWILPLGA